MAIPGKRFQEKHAPNFGKFEAIVFSAIVVSLVGFFLVAVYYGSLSSQIGPFSIAAVSAIGGFFAFYQLRRRDVNEFPTLRPGFKNTEEDDFGLQNFRSGPVLYLQVEVICEACNSTILTIKPDDKPTHLEQGEYYSLTDGWGPKIPNPGKECGCEGTYGDLTILRTYASEQGRQRPGNESGIDAREFLLGDGDYEPTEMTISYDEIRDAVEN